MKRWCYSYERTTLPGKKVSQGYEFNQATFNKGIPVTDSWFDQWHTLQAVWNNNKLDLYYDANFLETFPFQILLVKHMEKMDLL